MWLRCSSETLIFLVIHAGSVGLLLAPLLLGIAVLANGDALMGGYAAALQYTPSNLWSGAVFWNALNFHGFPSFISDSTSLSPLLYVLTAFLHPLRAIHWSLFLHFTLGAFFVSLLLRRLGISLFGALIGGTAFLASTFWMLPHFSISPAVFLLPVLCYASSFVLERFWLSTIGVAFALIDLVLATHYHYVPYVVLGWGAALAVCSIRCWRGGRQHATYAVILHAVIAGIIALPALLVRIIPALVVYGPLSHRSGGLSFREAATGGVQLGNLPHVLFPFWQLPSVKLLGLPDFLNAGPAWLFLGTFAFVFLLSAFFVRSSLVRPFAIAYLLFLFAAVSSSPLFYLLHKLPVLSYLREEGRWMFLANAAAIPLIGVGFDALLAGRIEHVRRVLAGGALLLFAALLLFSVVVTFTFLFAEETILSSLRQYFETYLSEKTIGLPPEHYYGALAQHLETIRRTFSFTEWKSVVPLLTFFLAAVCLGVFWKRLGQRRAPILALASVGTTVLVLLPQHDLLPLWLYHPETPTVAFLKSHAGASFAIFPNFFRHVVLDTPHNPTRREQRRFEAEFPLPNTNIYHSLETIDYSDNLMSQRMARLLAFVGSEQVEADPRFVLSDLPLRPEEKIERFMERRDILSLLNARYLVSAMPLPKPMKRVFETRVPPYDLPVYTYENADARPYVYFADAIVSIPEDEDAAFDFLTKERWSQRRTLIEFRGEEADPLKPTGKGKVEVLRKEPTHVTVRTESSTPQWLVLSQNRLPGWEVFIDGAPTSSFFANNTFFGIPVPSGTHTVELQFSLRQIFLPGLRVIAGRETGSAEHPI